MVDEKADIACLSETHLSDDNFKVPGYHCINNCRKNRARNTNVSHGGVSVLISNNVAYTYRIVVEKCQVEGLVIVKLKHKITCQNITIICAYIQPINSTWNNADEIIQAIITYLYSTADHGKIFFMWRFQCTDRCIMRL